MLCFCLHLSLRPALPLIPTSSAAPCCRDAADAEQHAGQLATSAASALQSARSSAALLTGRQGEVEPTDLEDLAASRLDAWLNEHPGAGSFQASGSLDSRGVCCAHSMQSLRQGRTLHDPSTLDPEWPDISSLLCCSPACTARCATTEQSQTKRHKALLQAVAAS